MAFSLRRIGTDNERYSIVQSGRIVGWTYLERNTDDGVPEWPVLANCGGAHRDAYATLSDVPEPLRSAHHGLFRTLHEVTTALGITGAVACAA